MADIDQLKSGWVARIDSMLARRQKELPTRPNDKRYQIAVEELTDLLASVTASPITDPLWQRLGALADRCRTQGGDCEKYYHKEQVETLPRVGFGYAIYSVDGLLKEFIRDVESYCDGTPFAPLKWS
jgi:hypothetical protein